jgi:hypothetical protein
MTGLPTRPPPDPIRELDGLRGIARALVLLWHLVNRQVLSQAGVWGWTARSNREAHDQAWPLRGKFGPKQSDSGLTAFRFIRKTPRGDEFPKQNGCW